MRRINLRFSSEVCNTFFVANRLLSGISERVPRKPTLLARQAKLELRRLVSILPRDSPLPTMQELGARCDLHPSTMFRMLKDLSAEGIVWQSPTGKFFAAAARQAILKRAPLCFIGREMWQWSRLYQKILDGVSEACSANESPLILLSAPSLVRQSYSTKPPQFAPPATQKKELASLLLSVPRGCGGLLLDHLWSRDALASSFPGGERIQLLFGTDPKTRVISPDYLAGARLVRQHLLERKFQHAILVNPFEGDLAIEASIQALRKELKEFPLREVAFSHVEKEIKRIQASQEKKACFLCPEDNTALAISARIGVHSSAQKIELIATQGTGMVNFPHPHLLYDFKKLGQSAAEAIFQGAESKPNSPTLLAFSPM